MAGLNECNFIGNLGADPELRHTSSGKPVCNFRLAVSESWKDAQGKPQERTEWLRVVVWGEQAEACAKYLQKGRAVHVRAKFQTREWEDKDGKKQSSPEFIAQHVLFLSGGKQGATTKPPTGGGEKEDDIPF